mmetsp:Transcript_10194/g.11104  ORF Transcript_10194/g.11104 Transcript_10194/m.11104 type:complete len:210 (+) Transcript_10194:60-689(+)
MLAETPADPVKVTISDECDQDYGKLGGCLSLSKKLGVDEKILFSENVVKYNPRNKGQNRLILVTNQALYNIKPGFSFFLRTRYRIKRRIPLKTISRVTKSLFSTECLFSIMNERDYRLKADHCNELVELISDLFTEKLSEDLEVREVYRYHLSRLYQRKNQKPRIPLQDRHRSRSLITEHSSSGSSGTRGTRQRQYKSVQPRRQRTHMG